MKLKNFIIFGLVFLFLISYVSAINIPYGGAHFWNFSRTTDYWGSNTITNNGVESKAVYPTFKISGNGGNDSFFFNTSSDDLNTTYIPSVTKDISFVLWIKPTNFPAGAIKFIFVSNAGTSGNVGYYCGIYGSTGLLRCYLTSGGSNKIYIESNKTLSFNQWNMIAFTVPAGTTTATLYINKSVVGKTNRTSGTGTASKPLIIGHYLSSATSSENYLGYMDWFQIYEEKLLTASEIEQLYNYGALTGTSITVIEPTNRTTIANTSTQTLNVSTVYPAYCKYYNSSSGIWSYGTIMNGTTRYHNTEIPSDIDKNYNLWFSCNATGIISNSSKYSIRTDSKKFNNYFEAIGDSIIQGAEVSANQRMPYLVSEFLDDSGYWGIVNVNQGSSGSCLSDYGSCSAHDPLVDRIVTDFTNYKSRFGYVLPNINDIAYDIPPIEYRADIESIFSNISANTPNTTVMTSSLHTTTGGNSVYDEYMNSLYTAEIREYAIINKIPFLEWHYIINHTSSYMVDWAHLNANGMILFNESIIPVLLNPREYIMNTSKFNIYHDCNTTIDILNWSVQLMTSNCMGTGTKDWLVLKNITSESFYIERADEDFWINRSNLLIGKRYVYSFSNGTNITNTVDGSGILDYKINAVTDLSVEIYEEASVTAKDSYLNTSLSNIAVRLSNGTTYTTSSGTVFLPFTSSDKTIHTLNISSSDNGGYFNSIYNWNFSLNSNLNASLNNTNITIYIKTRITNTTINTTTITIKDVTNSKTFTTSNGIKRINPRASTILFYINSTRPYLLNSSSSLIFSSLDNEINYLYMDEINNTIKFIDSINSSGISGATVNVTYPDGYSIIRTTNSTGHISFSSSSINGFIFGNYTLIFNKSGLLQTTTNIEITELTAPIDDTVGISRNYINFTFKDTNTESLITNITVEVISSSEANNYSTGSNSYLFIDSLYFEEYTIKYYRTGYETNYYYFIASELTAENITLYLVNSTSSTVVTGYVYDQDNKLKEGVLVKCLKYDLSTNSYVIEQMKYSNTVGQVQFNLFLGTEYYKFILEYPTGTVLETTTGNLIYSTSITFSINLVEDVAQDFYDTLDITHSLTFNNATNAFTFTYTDSNSKVSQGCMYIYEYSTGTNILANSSCVSATSASIILKITNTSGLKYIAKGYVTVNGNSMLIDSSIREFAVKVNYGKEGLLFTAILIIVVVTMFYTSISIALAFAGLPVILMSILGIIDLAVGYAIGLEFLMIVIAVWVSQWQR